MKLRILRNLGQDWPDHWREGQLADVTEDLAEKLIDARLAELVEHRGGKSKEDKPKDG